MELNKPPEHLERVPSLQRLSHHLLDFSFMAWYEYHRVVIFQHANYYQPILGGWLADAKWGRFRTICVGVAICGIAHVIMVIAGIPKLLQEGHAYAPFMISVYTLAIGAGTSSFPGVFFVRPTYKHSSFQAKY